MSQLDLLTPILERKRQENARRLRHVRHVDQAGHVDLVDHIGLEVGSDASRDRNASALAALARRAGEPPRVIAEIKRQSPSAGVIRARAVGDVVQIARGYADAGAAAVSVLCDRVGFGGSVLDLRRAAHAVSIPLLFKEFVLDDVQVALARRAGAHMVLLLVRAVTIDRLHALVDAVLALGMAPVVEAADEQELRLALTTRATIIGVNARDLRTFRVDPEAAQRALASIPGDRIAVHMSGVHDEAAFARVASSRADAVLIGEGLMRAPDPGARLRELLSSAARQ